MTVREFKDWTNSLFRQNPEGLNSFGFASLKQDWFWDIQVPGREDAYEIPTRIYEQLKEDLLCCFGGTIPAVK